MISLNAEMARVANVERGNFVCEYHWHILRTTNNIRPYPLPSHPRAMNPTLIPAKLFQVFDEVGKACLSIESERGCARESCTGKLFFKKGREPVSQDTIEASVPGAWDRSGSRRRRVIILKLPYGHKSLYYKSNVNVFIMFGTVYLFIFFCKIINHPRNSTHVTPMCASPATTKLMMYALQSNW